MQKKKRIDRDISWLSFNERVLQEAADPTVPLKERIKFLGIFSNNLDEFFRVRVATLRKMADLKAKQTLPDDYHPQLIIETIQDIVLKQQIHFEQVWKQIQKELAEQKIFLRSDKKLSAVQQKFVLNYFNEEVRSSIVPLMIENIQQFPTLNDRSIYLACKLYHSHNLVPRRFALLPIPVGTLPRFVRLPGNEGEYNIILLEDVIRFCLPVIFSAFEYNKFTAHLVKLTRDAEIDIDNDIAGTLIQKIEKGLKNRKKGKPVRFVFDKDIDLSLLTYLVKRLGLSLKENLVPGGRIHNFKDFIQFPAEVFALPTQRKKPFTHPQLRHAVSVSKVLFQKDVLLHFPYHSFDSVIDLLREAAIDEKVQSIKITCYRLAHRSKIVNALVNAARNGKQVTVALELRARFDEEANLGWKTELEEAGVKVLLGLPHQKMHAKICVIKKREATGIVHYGFISTGNPHEQTAQLYGDHCLLTANKKIMADVNRMFSYLENPKARQKQLLACRTLLVSPVSMRQQLLEWIEKEIKIARQNKPAAITLKLNSLSDPRLIAKLEDAARAGVALKLIVRGIFCMHSESKKYKIAPRAISIVDEYLEHARIMIFGTGEREKIYISSADWMVRNLDHRVEAACPITDKEMQDELKAILQLQLMDNVKARLLNNSLSNHYVPGNNQSALRSQVAIYQLLSQKK